MLLIESSTDMFTNCINAKFTGTLLDRFVIRSSYFKLEDFEKASNRILFDYVTSIVRGMMFNRKVALQHSMTYKMDSHLKAIDRITDALNSIVNRCTIERLAVVTTSEFIPNLQELQPDPRSRYYTSYVKKLQYLTQFCADHIK